MSTYQPSPATPENTPPSPTGFPAPPSTPQSSPFQSSPLMECPAGKWWVCALLGVVFLIAGAFVLINAVAASIVSAIFFAAAMVVGGAFQIIHAFSAKGWGSLALSLAIGVLFVAGGLLLMFNPLATSMGLTLGVAAMMIVSGVTRLVMARRHWDDYGWVLVISAVLAIATGVVLLAGFPWSGLVVPGVLLGLDLVMMGAWWLVLGAFVRRPRAGADGPTLAAMSP